MRLRCFFLGCHWDEGSPTDVGHVPMLCQRCARCGAQRYLALERLETKSLSPEPEI
ncbi:PSPA7_2676 family Cys-rich small protein [Pseudomonas nitroreducens]|uniref:PSPA7_2676 family Cys-rich small protein n=1 Tax=Pseudomonas TaxID=286 RepID=UPI002F3604BC